MVPTCADQGLGILNIAVEGKERDQGKSSRLKQMMKNEEEIKEEEEKKQKKETG